MSIIDHCEESVATATSTVLAADVIMVVLSTAAAASTPYCGVTNLLISSGVASDTAYPEQYALVTSSAGATGTPFVAVEANQFAESSARARSTPFIFLDQLAVSTAVGTSTAFWDVDIQPYVSTAHATSSVVAASTTSNVLATSTAQATGTYFTGLSELVVSTASAVSSVVAAQRTVSVLAESTASAAGTAYPTVFVSMLLESSAFGTGTPFVTVETNALEISTANAESWYWFRDPGLIAWVLNTESTAASLYDNYSFDSIAQTPNKVLAVGADGLYELTGDTDDGDAIRSEIVTGFTDFGVVQTKRLDSIYFGYTSGGRISIAPEVKESGFPPITYYLEQRDAGAPRNSRVTPGKGLFGRYWRVTVQNVDGVEFEVHDSTADIAVSNRRV